jgi:hypothetical protein
VSSLGDYPADESGVIDIGHRHFLRPAEPAGFLWWHDCPAAEHVSWGWFGAVGGKVSGHVIEPGEPLTVAGSLVCTDCGDHGWVRAGQWVPV